ncbi:copper resistance D family protein [Domibacillus epiphyticus]|uniref:Copper resistance protein CopD n=1 Tax=Domibacillus epiphyticus TaxID=1714355 RepID=A0A1V2A3Y4_9BACI|nr:CopD family protein [Domibacillus epiphyticus]OMP65630.1 copper resistance protein CopD [Domibacillus epiphyticus]
MIYTLYLTETLLYVCFSFLMGTFLIQLIPSTKKPSIYIHKCFVQLPIFGIIIFSCMPVAYLASALFSNGGISLQIQDILFTFEIGKAWIFTFIISIFFLLFVSLFPVLNSKRQSTVSIVIILILIFTIGWASHPASAAGWIGFMGHSIHFTAVSAWMGILMIVSWFSKDQENWLAFLKWFSPVAMVCFGLTMLSGFLMMTNIFDLKDYANSWMLNYGQALLVKHIAVFPILIFAFINGYWTKTRMQKEGGFRPIPWVRAESLVLLLIFSVTAFLGQQEPPQEVEATVKNNGVSPLFHYFFGGTAPAMPVQFELNFMNISLFTISAVFLLLIFWSFFKKAAAVSFVLSVLLIISIYFALMAGIQ